MRIARLIAIAVIATGCAAQVARPVAPLTVEDHLRRVAVADDDFYRGVFYTWTTAEGAAALRSSRRLLVATAATGGFASPFNRALAVVARRPGRAGDLARLLTTDPTLIRRRYAWPAPFATVMGLGERTYGNALVRIALAPDAWIGRFEPASAQPFRFVDLAGAPVALRFVLAEPGRIGAIYHVRVEADRPVPFREYVLCNPAMIASWSIATRAIRDEIDAERALLRAVRARLPAASLDPALTPRRVWRRARARTGGLAAAWLAALAFANDRYALTAAALDAIDQALAAYDGAGPPLEESSSAP